MLNKIKSLYTSTNVTQYKLQSLIEQNGYTVEYTSERFVPTVEFYVEDSTTIIYTPRYNNPVLTTYYMLFTIIGVLLYGSTCNKDELVTITDSDTLIKITNITDDIVMPEEQFRGIVSDIKINSKVSVEKIATHFGVSYSKALSRARKLGII